MTFYLFAIKEFVEASSKFTVNGVFSTYWRDERLSWIPEEYNNITKTLVSQNKVWIPDIVIVNPFKEAYGLGSNLVKIYLNNEGFCDWATMQSFEVICDADVTYYPFDRQYCALRFVAFTAYEDWLNITFPNSKVFLTQYEESGLWKIENTTNYSYTDKDGTTYVVVGLYLKRRYAYYLAGLILPMTVVAILQAFVFLVPYDAGERVGFSVTILLTSVVFLTIIQEKLPEASEPNISVLGFLLFGYVVLGSVVTLCVILSANIHSYTENIYIPKWLKHLCCVKTNSVEDSCLSSIDMKSGPKEKENEECPSCSWKEVAKQFDRICFITSLFLYALQIIIYFGLAV
jgi:hypothetical protein